MAYTTDHARVTTLLKGEHTLYHNALVSIATKSLSKSHSLAAKRKAAILIKSSAASRALRLGIHASYRDAIARTTNHNFSPTQ